MSSQIAKIVRLLGSDQEGEVLVAVRKLGALLKENNKDWHWLAAMVEEQLHKKKTLSPIDAAIHAYAKASQAQPKRDNSLVQFTVELVGKSELAWKFLYKGHSYFINKGQVKMLNRKGSTMDIEITTWKAKELGWL